MLSTVGNPLVAGAAPTPMATRFIKVLRAFYFQNAVQSVGSVIEVPALFAAEVIHSNKAAPCEPPKAEPKAEPTPEPEADPAPVFRRKRNAQ